MKEITACLYTEENELIAKGQLLEQWPYKGQRGWDVICKWRV